jgi:hypothetical protein
MLSHIFCVYLAASCYAYSHIRSKCCQVYIQNVLEAVWGIIISHNWNKYVLKKNLSIISPPRSSRTIILTLWYSLLELVQLIYAGAYRSYYRHSRCFCDIAIAYWNRYGCLLKLLLFCCVWTCLPIKTSYSVAARRRHSVLECLYRCLTRVRLSLKTSCSLLCRCSQLEFVLLLFNADMTACWNLCCRAQMWLSLKSCYSVLARLLKCILSCLVSPNSL